MTLSQDLRLRIVDLVETGVSRRHAARQFKVSVSSAIRFVKQAQELGHVEPKKPKKRKSCLDPFRAEILEWIADQPDLTLAELRERLDEHHTACVLVLQRFMTGLPATRSPIKKPHTPVNKNVVTFKRLGLVGANARAG